MGPVGLVDVPVSQQATVEGKPFLETGPEGYHSRETIFGNRPRGPWPEYPGDLGPQGPRGALFQG